MKRTLHHSTEILTAISAPLRHEPVFFAAIVASLYMPHILYKGDALLSLTDSLPGMFAALRWVAVTLSYPIVVAYLLAWAAWKSRSRWLKAAAGGVAGALLAVDLFLLYRFGTVLTSWMLLLIEETNRREASEFAGRYLLSGDMLAGTAIVLLLTTAVVCADSMTRKPILRSHRLQAITALLLLPFFPTGVYLVGKTLMLPFESSQESLEEWYAHHGEYATQNTVGHLAYSVVHLRMAGHDNERAIACSIEASRQEATCREADTLTVVLVVGESFSKHHASLYGYPIDTTPTLRTEAAEGHLTAFERAETPYNMTTFAMKNMLSTNDLSHGEAWCDRPMFPVIFRKAGYTVNFWDNQRPDGDVSPFDFALGSYLYSPTLAQVAYDRHNSHTFDYDGQLVDSFVAHHASSRHTLHILHLMGQHSDAAQRYPHTAEWDHFGADDIPRPDLSDAQRQAMAEYDNATLYNDHVMKMLFDHFRHQSAVLVYLSDHGEEVYDYRDFAGRSHETVRTPEIQKYQYQIPMVVWYTESYKESHPEQVAAIRRAATRTFLSSDLPHLLLSLGGIDTPYYNARQDILSEAYGK